MWFPDLCEFVLDVRVTDSYSLEEALEELGSALNATLTPRSYALTIFSIATRSFSLAGDHSIGT